MKGQIIIINGTSGSGKSTACELFARTAEDFWLLYGIDHFMGATFPRQYGQHGKHSKEGIYAQALDETKPDGTLHWVFSQQAYKAFHAFHRWIAASSEAGCNIILDHLMMTEPKILQDCIWALKDYPVLFVNLKPPYEVLQERISTREIGQRFPNSNYDEEQIKRSKERLERLRPWFYQAVYTNDCYDLEIDTAHYNPEQVCELIKQRLKQGPGIAFEKLRGRYPQ